MIRGQAVICDRCQRAVSYAGKSGTCTMGYYDVTEGDWWAQFCNVGERHVCDRCMWQDERYIEVYGRHSV